MILPVQTPGGGYDVVVESGALQRAGEYLPFAGKALIVTDDGVPAEYARTIARTCEWSHVVVLPQGEKTKCLESHRMLLEQMLKDGFSREDRVIAVGGGVMGDLAGFAAAVYMRGIDFYNVPTTLLAQVDSSIGGKVAVDMDGVKNVVGAFYPPRKVLVDPETLQTLDPRQLSAGLAEAVKTAVCLDEEFFCRLEQGGASAGELPYIVESSLRAKRKVVEQDPGEKGLRRVLNFGHTLGHAVESATGGRWLHGECVAAGMPPMCSPQVRERLTAVLEKFHLPTKIPCGREELLSFLRHDKKAGKDGVTVVWVETVGRFQFRQTSFEEAAERAGL